MELCAISELVGKTMTSVLAFDAAAIRFKTTDHQIYQLYHDQDDDERVYIELIHGNLSDLMGSPIIVAEESVGKEPREIDQDDTHSHSWTFYKFATLKGIVHVRWFGRSNGWCSERPDMFKITA